MDRKNLFSLIGAMIILVSCTAVPEVNEFDLPNNTNVKLRSLSLRPAVDRRSEYTEQFCNNIRLYEAELDYGKNCAAYIHGANRRSARSQSKNQSPKI